MGRIGTGRRARDAGGDHAGPGPVDPHGAGPRPLGARIEATSGALAQPGHGNRRTGQPGLLLVIFTQTDSLIK